VMGSITVEEVGHVSAHALGMVEEDAIEAQAIEQTLGNVPVTALKSFFGNLGASSNAVELAINLDGLQQGIIPPTLNYKEADPACPVNVVTSSLNTKSPNLLAVSHTLMGQAVSLLVGTE
jgi:3-oxoacyl-[acyl-carrier-protein] synthase II